VIDDVVAVDLGTSGREERFALFFHEDSASPLIFWLVELSRGYTMFDEEDLYAKIDGPTVIEPLPEKFLDRLPDPPPEPRPSQADLSAFRSMVQSRISSARRYPQSARDAGQEGTVRVSFSVSPSGQPSGISVASSSGYQSLDAAARRAVSAAAPYRPFPKHMDSSIRVTATVIFRLN